MADVSALVGGKLEELHLSGDNFLSETTRKRLKGRFQTSLLPDIILYNKEDILCPKGRERNSV